MKDNETGRTPGESGSVADELGQQTRQEAQNLPDKIMDAGTGIGSKIGEVIDHAVDRVEHVPSDLGHATARGEHTVAKTIHDTVVGGIHKIEDGLGHLFHRNHGHMQPPPSLPQAPPPETPDTSI